MAEIPLIKCPIAEILATARAAGRAAFITRAVIENHCDAVSMDWFNKVMPSSLDLMDDDAFGDLLEKATAAFDEGVTEYLTSIEGKDALGEKAVSALEREVKDEQFQVQCAQEVFDWLAGIFRAIQSAADACPDMRSRGEIKRLAGCGQYLADDRADMLSNYVGEEASGGDHA